jgi:hypothetical protein
MRSQIHRESDYKSIYEKAGFTDSDGYMACGKANGYDGFGDALKGNFKSNNLGETLLFVQSKSSPTIRIKRDGAKDIYISFRHAEIWRSKVNWILKSEAGGANPRHRCSASNLRHAQHQRQLSDCPHPRP